MNKIYTTLKKLFRRVRVLSLPELSQQLNGRSERSLFRDLKTVGYHSSYTHAGKYYTLACVAHFDPEGLWNFQGIGFSKYGTLKNTLIELINRSKSGETHEALSIRLHVRVQNQLLDLSQTKKLRRERVNHVYVYFSGDPIIAEKQIKHRREGFPAGAGLIKLPSEVIQIEIFAEIIRTNEICADASKLHQQLQKRELKISLYEINQVLSYYEIKKNGI